MSVMTHDVILRHLRIRPGEQSKGDDAIEFIDAERCIADHCSFEWGDDETCSITGLSDAITIQHCIIAEGLNHAGHSMASICGGERTTWHHNLIAHCRTRNPRFADVVNCDFRNNVIYNWEGACNLASGRFNLISNYWRPGPNTDFKRDPFPIAPKAEADDVTVGHLAGNHFEDKPDWNADNYRAFQFGTRGGKYIGEVTQEKFVQPAEFVAQEDRPITQPAEKAYQLVLAHAGASKARDAADKRVVEGIIARTHRRIDSQKEVGGWPELKSAPAPKDNDGDGMPDAWEVAHNLNPAEPGDGNQRQSEGWTNLELYLNNLAIMR